MSRWLLALLFAFGTVTFLTGCPAEETVESETETETETLEDGTTVETTETEETVVTPPADDEDSE